MTTFANDRQEMGRIAALEASLDAAEKRAEAAEKRAQEMVKTLPDCMMPDGSDPCKGYHELRQRAEAAERALADALAAKDTAEAQVVVLRRAMDEVPLTRGSQYEAKQVCQGCGNRAEYYEDIAHRGGCWVPDIRAALASLPDRAAKIRAVVVVNWRRLATELLACVDTQAYSHERFEKLRAEIQQAEKDNPI